MQNYNNLELKSAVFCTVALLAVLLIVCLTGCAATTKAKVDAGGKTFSTATDVGVRVKDN
jgi:hypothetical protein